MTPFACLSAPDPAPLLGWIARAEPAPEWDALAARLGLRLASAGPGRLRVLLREDDPCGLLLDGACLAAAPPDALAGDPLLPVWLAGRTRAGALPPAWLLRHPGFEGELEDPRRRGTPSRIARALCRYVTHRRAAERDSLTGLPDRAGFTRWLARARAAAPDREWQLVLVDLCDLKGTNRRDGYEAGDRRIVAAAQAFAGRLDPAAPRGRWGGDELVAAVPAPVPPAPPRCRVAWMALPLEHPPLPALLELLHRALDAPEAHRTARAVRS